MAPLPQLPQNEFERTSTNINVTIDDTNLNDINHNNSVDNMRQEGMNTSFPTSVEEPDILLPNTQRDTKCSNIGHCDIPLVEVSIENLTYAPMVTTVTTKPTTTTTTGTTDTNTKANTTNNNNIAKKTIQQRKVILNDITTQILPYQLTAWMGPSGCGKTSLISVMAGLISNIKEDISDTSSMKVNHEIGTIPKNLIGVVWQDDLLLSNLTVEESLYYVARLKSSSTISNETIQIMVNETMKELNIYNIRHSLIGAAHNTTTQRNGISGGERKRVTVGMELVTRPSVLLLDEITSGLDSTTAHNLIVTLHELAHTKGHTIVVVIHQPRTTIFNMFDHLLLLSKGNVIYNGPPKLVRNYLELHYTPLPPETSIADWMMDIIIHIEKYGTNNELIENWKKYQSIMKSNNNSNDNETTDMTQQQHQQIRQQRRLTSLYELQVRPKYHIQYFYQLQLLLYRTMKQQRGERITRMAFLLQLLYVFCTSILWFRIPFNTSRIYERNSLFFFILIAQANQIVITAVTVFHTERILLLRERAKKMYHISCYFIAKTISDVTNNILLPLLYAMVVYWTAGFRPTFIAYIKYIFVFYWIFSTAQSMGLFISIAIPNRTLSLLFAPPITLFFAILGGFYIPLDSLPPSVQWITYLSFARYGYSALLINEYEDRTIPCSDNVSIGIGISQTEENCPINGEEVMTSFGIHGIYQNFWFNVVMMIILQLFFRVGAYIVLRRSK